MDPIANTVLAEATALIDKRLQIEGCKMTPDEQVLELAIALLERVGGTDEVVDELTEFGLSNVITLNPKKD